MTVSAFVSTGHALQTALTEQPALTLEFYSFGTLLKKREGDTVSEFAVDPAQVASALAAKVTFETGLLSGDTLFIRAAGLRQTVVEYRKGQLTGLYLEGSESPLRVPLPPLLLIRTTTEDRSPAYLLFAVKKRPVSLDAELFIPPLQNVYGSGSICWGSVPSAGAVESCALAQGWHMLLGSPFGDHSCQGKSRSHPTDIRQKLIDLEGRKARVYPKSDLISAGRTLAQVLA